MPKICQKNVHSLKKTVLSCQVFHDKPPAAMPIFGKRNSNYVKTPLHYWPKSQRMPFFPIFHVKISADMPIFCHKNIHSLKNKSLCSHSHIVKITSILSKTLCSYVIFSKFSWKTPCCQDHIWSKNVNSLKNTL